MEKVRIGVIGAGGIAGLHLNAYINNPDVEVVALCDKNIEIAQIKAKDFNIPYICDDPQSIFARNDIDAISITTPNWTHAQFTIDALNSGKHVLCEKPPALNAKDTTRMVESAKKNNCILMFGFEGKFAEKIQYTKKAILNGSFGNIYYVKASYLRRCGNPGGWFASKDLSGGGPLIDLGIHMIDLCLYLTGNPEPVSVFASTYSKFGDRSNLKDLDWYKTNNYQQSNFDVEDLAVALVKFRNGATLFLETSFDLHSKGMDEIVHFDIYGDQAGATIDPGFEIFTEKDDHLIDYKPVMDDDTINWDKCLEKEVNHFVDCALSKTDCLFSAADAIPIVKITDAIYQSAKQGTSINIDT